MFKLDKSLDASKNLHRVERSESDRFLGLDRANSISSDRKASTNYPFELYEPRRNKNQYCTYRGVRNLIASEGFIAGNTPSLYSVDIVVAINPEDVPGEETIPSRRSPFNDHDPLENSKNECFLSRRRRVSETMVSSSFRRTPE